MAGGGYVHSCTKLMRAIAIFSFLFFIGYSPNSCVPGGNLPEGIKESNRGFLGDPIWSMDSCSLYFTERTRDYKEIEIRKYDLLAGTTSTVFAGPNTSFMTINGCNEIFVCTYKDPMNSFFIISSLGPRYYNFHELKQIIFPIWLSNCSEVVFLGCGRQDCCGVFLWNKDSNTLKQINSFSFKTKRPNGVEVDSVYMRFASSFVARRIISSYQEAYVDNHKVETTFNLGAMDLDTGEVWKIAELGEWGEENYRWFSSDDQDLIYFFKWNVTGHLDSLWKIRSDGTGASKVLDGKAIGPANSQGTHVSWSKGAEKVVVKCSLDKEKRTVLVNTLAGKVNELDLGTNPIVFALSPDGKKLAYISDNDVVYILDIESGIKQKIF